MSSEGLVATNPPFITAQWQKFRETRSLRCLMRAILLVMRQQRTTELLYGVYCSLFHRASTISPVQDEAALISVIKEKTALVHKGAPTRAELIERYGATFKVGLLPEDFESARCESIWQEGNEFLILGEYGEGARLACVTTKACFINEHYQHVPGVRHIHSVERYGNGGEFLVATGDAKEFLDLWSTEYGQVRFVRRLRRNLAGFTAAIQVDGQYYFGTDFSSRPNYITTFQGTKF
ncbi:MAG TPA: hypothetical protein VE399_03585, partial [Gemmatimonadales bacterium]|nr:hypothetical protein [Gemmatimonadales bacterium]